MSKLLKSKFLLGAVIVAVMAVGAVAFATPVAAACTITSTLRVGSTGDQVACLQSIVGATADGKFGPLTKASVMAWQSGHGLVADGVVGPLTRAVLSSSGSTTTTGTTYSPGCSAGTAYSSTTGQPCTSTVTSTNLPAGCTSTAGYSSTTGVSCATGEVTATATATGPVTVTLATDNPASGSFIAPASGVVFAKFTFTGAGPVTSIKLQRTGISASTTLSNIYLYDGATRLTDGASLSSDNTATFNAPNGIFTVAGSKTISVVADTLVADYSLALSIIDYTANSTASVVNVAGNEMFGASATLATLALSAATGSGAIDPGLDILVWQSTATVNTRDVLLKSLALRQTGSIAAADIGNFKLYADGVLVQTVSTLDSNGYVTFSTSYALKTGARVLKVTADIIGGSSRTVQFSLRGAYDVLATDTQYNANGTATGTFPNNPTAFTVNAGSLTVVKKTTSPASNLTRGASDQNLATFSFTAYGEPIKVETLRVGMITNGTPANVTLRNVRILVDGAPVGSNTSVPAAASFAVTTGTSFTTNFIVYPGKPATVEIHSDIYDTTDAGGDTTDDIGAGTVTTIQAVFVAGDINNGVPQVSITAVDVPSTTTNATGNTLTISAGTMAVAKTTSYVNRLITVPQTAYKIGSYQLTGNSTEAVNLNTIYVGFTSGSDVTEETDLSDLYVVYGGTMTTVKGSVSSTILNGNSWSINRTLAKNETMAIDVYATIASSVGTSEVIQSTLAVAGTTADSGVATYADAADTTSLSAGASGQTVTQSAGTLVMSVDAANTPLSQLIDDSGTIKTLTAKLVATTDSYTVTDLTLNVTEVSAVSSVTLKDHDTGVAIGAAKPSAAAAADLTWSGLEILVNAGTTKRIDVELALAPVGVSAGTTDDTLTTTISTITARNSAGTSAATGAGTVSGTAAGNAMYIYKAVPLVSLVALPNSTLAGGEMVIAKFSVSGNGTGSIAWKQALLEVTKSTAPTLALPTLWNSDTGIQVNAFIEYQNSALTGGGGVATTCVADVNTCEIRITIDADSDSVADDDYTEQVSGAKIYELRSTVGGTLASGNSVSVKFDRNTTAHAASAAYATNDNAGTAGSVSFTWSDESVVAGDTGEATWQKDFLVKNLPITWNLNRN